MTTFSKVPVILFHIVFYNARNKNFSVYRHRLSGVEAAPSEQKGQQDGGASVYTKHAYNLSFEQASVINLAK